MGWSVEVRRDDEVVVTIEDRMLSGKADLLESDEELIRQCASQLLAFVGPRPVTVWHPGKDE